MESSNPPPELSLDSKPTSIPKSISQFILQVSKFGTLSHNTSTVNDLVNRLETEMRKIHAFKRELPLCMLLVNDVIIALKEESMVFKKPKPSIGGPVVEEFMPVLKTCGEDSDEDKKNWLSSTQLWNNNGDNESSKIPSQKPNSTDQTIKKGCGFELGLPIPPGIKNSIKGNILVTKTSPDGKWVPSSSPNGQSNLRTGASHGSPSQQQTSRKQRRCWSNDLHRRFVNALQQLGGSQAATPKQIRELMQVDDLTNDEVKSHLQKYRLHTRRLPSSNTSSANQSSGWILGSGQRLLPRDQYVESTKHGICQSGSPDGPLLLCTTTATTGGDSMDDGEDAKSENYCWKGV